MTERHSDEVLAWLLAYLGTDQGPRVKELLAELQAEQRKRHGRS